MNFVIGTLSNVVANLIFWVLLGLAFWLASVFLARRFMGFFGLRSTHGVNVYLSNLFTPEGKLSGRTDGYTISLHELRAAQSIDKILGSAPLRLPDLVRGLVDSLWLRGQLQFEVLVSPLNSSDADFSRNMVVVGSSVRNSVRAHYLSAGLPTAVFSGEKLSGDVRGRLDPLSKIAIIRDGNDREMVHAQIEHGNTREMSRSLPWNNHIFLSRQARRQLMGSY